MDLHAWITQQVDAIEAAARESVIGRRITLALDDGRSAITGTITAAGQGPDGFTFGVAQYGIEPVDATPAPMETATAVLRRCEADRRILDRHHADPDRSYDTTACVGCGFSGHLDLMVTDNINDCPELLDLGHAHGLTEDILAGLGRPQQLATTPFDVDSVMRGGIFVLPDAPVDLPPTFRGPRWSTTN